MKVVFVYPAFGSLAIESLSAMAKSRGHDVSLVFDPRLFEDSFVSIAPLAWLFRVRKKVAERVVALKPDVVAFSVVTSDYIWFREISAMVREKLPNVAIIAGNIHATSAPEEVLRHCPVDAIVCGEGDLAIVELLDSLASGGLKPDMANLGYIRDGEVVLNPLRPLIQDLDTIPFADKTLYADTPINARDIYTIMSSRGCPYMCSFCNNDLMKRLYGLKGYVRTRSVDNVIEELEHAKKTYNSRYINFYDEVFGVNTKWLADFTEKYNSKIARPYIACTNPNVVNEEYAELLKNSGCCKVDIGVQTINENKRREIYHRRESTDRIRMAITLLQKNGIYVAAENITNFPTETEDDMVEMARFYNEVRPDVLKVFWLRYFPGTEIVNIALEHGALTREDVRRINAGEHVASITIDSSAPKLHRRFYLLYILTQVFPRNMVEYIIRHKIYRWLPSAGLPGIAYTMYRLLIKKPADAEIMMRQHAARYKFYLGRFFDPRRDVV